MVLKSQGNKNSTDDSAGGLPSQERARDTSGPDKGGYSHSDDKTFGEYLAEDQVDLNSVDTHLAMEE